MPNQMLQKLNDKHQHFCEMYLIHFAPQKAAIEAGFGKFQGYNLLRDTLIKKYIKKRTAEIMSEIKEEQLKIFRELMKVGHSKIRDLYNADGSLKRLEDWPEDIASCVSSIKQKIKKNGDKTDVLYVRTVLH